jgi:hypothetical protein
MAAVPAHPSGSGTYDNNGLLFDNDRTLDDHWPLDDGGA